MPPRKKFSQVSYSNWANPFESTLDPAKQGFNFAGLSAESKPFGYTRTISRTPKEPESPSESETSVKAEETKAELETANEESISTSESLAVDEQLEDKTKDDGDHTPETTAGNTATLNDEATGEGLTEAPEADGAAPASTPDADPSTDPSNEDPNESTKGDNNPEQSKEDIAPPADNSPLETKVAVGEGEEITRNASDEQSSSDTVTEETSKEGEHAVNDTVAETAAENEDKPEATGDATIDHGVESVEESSAAPQRTSSPGKTITFAPETNDSKEHAPKHRSTKEKSSKSASKAPKKKKLKPKAENGSLTTTSKPVIQASEVPQPPEMETGMSGEAKSTAASEEESKPVEDLIAKEGEPVTPENQVNVQEIIPVEENPTPQEKTGNETSAEAPENVSTDDSGDGNMSKESFEIGSEPMQTASGDVFVHTAKSDEVTLDPVVMENLEADDVITEDDTTEQGTGSHDTVVEDTHTPDGLRKEAEDHDDTVADTLNKNTSSVGEVEQSSEGKMAENVEDESIAGSKEIETDAALADADVETVEESIEDTQNDEATMDGASKTTEENHTENIEQKNPLEAGEAEVGKADIPLASSAEPKEVLLVEENATVQAGDEAETSLDEPGEEESKGTPETQDDMPIVETATAAAEAESSLTKNESSLISEEKTEDHEKGQPNEASLDSTETVLKEPPKDDHPSPSHSNRSGGKEKHHADHWERPHVTPIVLGHHGKKVTAKEKSVDKTKASLEYAKRKKKEALKAAEEEEAAARRESKRAAQMREELKVVKRAEEKRKRQEHRRDERKREVEDLERQIREREIELEKKRKEDELEELKRKEERRSRYQHEKEESGRKSSEGDQKKKRHEVSARSKETPRIPLLIRTNVSSDYTATASSSKPSTRRHRTESPEEQQHRHHHHHHHHHRDDKDKQKQSPDGDIVHDNSTQDEVTKSRSGGSSESQKMEAEKASSERRHHHHRRDKERDGDRPRRRASDEGKRRLSHSDAPIKGILNGIKKALVPSV